MRVEYEFPELHSGINKLLRKIENMEFEIDVLKRRANASDNELKEHINTGN
jgi:hypothetical protein